MHTFLLTWSANHIAGFDPATAPPDQYFLLGVFGISNFLTGFLYLLISRKARELAPAITILIPLVYLAFLVWYGERGKPLTPGEVENLLAEIKRRAGKQAQGEDESPILQEFRELAKSDDGRAYYMVNLLKFRPKPRYPPGSLYGDDPLVANNRYNRNHPLNPMDNSSCC